MLIDAPALDEDRAARAVAALQSGGIGAFPTETFYGLAADALDARAVGRVASVKGRAMGKAIACIIGGLSQRHLLCEEWPPEADRLAERFWPGPLTLVVPARAGLPAPLSPEGWVGFRLSAHPWARELAMRLGRPITATSANLGGQSEAGCVQEIAPALLDNLDFVLDAGRLPGGAGSTVVQLVREGPRCLRDGAIPFRTVATFLDQPP
jgi:L-threonylcarbamoyladenylate synthase